MLKPVQSVVKDAVDAAIRVADETRSMRGMESMSLGRLVRYVDNLQTQFEAIRPVALLPSVDVQAAAVALYGAGAPADVAALFISGQQAGGGVVMAADAVYQAAPPRDWVLDMTMGRYAPRNVAGTDMASLHGAMDVLLDVLAPVAGNG